MWFLQDQTNSGLLQYLKSREWVLCSLSCGALNYNIIIYSALADMIKSLDKEESSLQAHMTVIKLHGKWCLDVYGIREMIPY